MGLVYVAYIVEDDFASKQENEYSQGLKLHSAGRGTLNLVVMAQCGETRLKINSTESSSRFS